MKKDTKDTILKKNSITCPKCKDLLQFEVLQGMRIIREGYISARCLDCKTYYKVKG